MNSRTQRTDIADQLLQQEILQHDSKYQEYRMRLENALEKVEHRERLIGHVVWISFLTAFILMFIGGSKVFGPFDPSEEGANIVSLVLSVVYVIAAIAFPVALASYLSRLRPRTADARKQLREANQGVVRAEICELRQQIALLAREQHGDK